MDENSRPRKQARLDTFLIPRRDEKSQRQLFDLIKITATTGESNSVLVIGPRGSGRTMDRSKSTPIPIFNHRKRPRQAVIADPQDGQGNNKYSNLMPVGGFSGNHSSSNTGQGFKRFSSFNNNEVNDRGDNWRHNNQHYQKGDNQPQSLKQNSVGYDHQGNSTNLYGHKNSASTPFNQRNFNSNMNPAGDGSGYNREQTRQGSNSIFPSKGRGYTYQNNGNQSNKEQQGRGYCSSTVTSSQNNQESFNQQYNNNSQLGKPMQRNETDFQRDGDTPRYNKQSFQGNQNSRPNCSGSQQGNQQNCRSNRQDSQQNNWQNYNSNRQDINQHNVRSNQDSVRSNQQKHPPNFKNTQQNGRFNQTNAPGMPSQGSTSSNRFTSGIPVDSSPARGATFPSQQRVFSGQPQPTNADRNKGQKNLTSQAKKQRIDPSLHVMTLNLSKIDYWAKYKDNINMIFEVFGIIDSAVTRDPAGFYKEFKLRDGQHQIKCVFYEIDRVLTKLTRGHWHRCMGTYDVRNGCFKCVSVRTATVDEKNHGQQHAEATNELLKQMTKHLPEQ